MSSIKPIRDPKTDHLLTPENSALLVIDYQPIQVHSITSMDRGVSFFSRFGLVERGI